MMSAESGAAAEHTAKKSSPRINRRRLKQNIPYLIMFLPVIVYFLVFKYGPIGGNIVAFKQYNFADGIWGSPWVGFQQFEMLLENPQVWKIIRNSLVLSLLNIFIGFPFPILLAIMLNEVRAVWFKRSVQTLVYLPHFLSWVIIGGIVVTLFANNGFLNALLKQWFGEPFPFLYHEGSWISIFVGSGIWRNAGWSAIIYLAALSSIDPHLYEAASIDGAGKFRKIMHITLPGISSVVVLMFILNMGQVMEVGFDHIFVLQNPTVKNISEVISTYIFRLGILGMQFSMTAAIGLFESVIGLIFVLTANTLARRYGKGLW